MNIWKSNRRDDERFYIPFHEILVASSIGLKWITAQFETTGGHEKFDVLINDPTPDGDCVDQSITASTT